MIRLTAELAALCKASLQAGIAEDPPKMWNDFLDRLSRSPGFLRNGHHEQLCLVARSAVSWRGLPKLVHLNPLLHHQSLYKMAKSTIAATKSSAAIANWCSPYNTEFADRGL